MGAYLQITGAVAEDLDVPGKPYTFGQLQAAQAAGDRLALAGGLSPAGSEPGGLSPAGHDPGRGRPLLHLHLTDRSAGLERLLDAARKLGA